MKKSIVLGVAVIANLALSDTGFGGAYDHAHFDCDNTCGVQCGYHIFVEKALYKKADQQEVGKQLNNCMLACVELCPQQQESCGQTLG